MGGERQQVSIDLAPDGALAEVESKNVDRESLNEALEKLKAQNERLYTVVTTTLFCRTRDQSNSRNTRCFRIVHRTCLTALPGQASCGFEGNLERFSG